MSGSLLRIRIRDRLGDLTISSRCGSEWQTLGTGLVPAKVAAMSNDLGQTVSFCGGKGFNTDFAGGIVHFVEFPDFRSGFRTVSGKNSAGHVLEKHLFGFAHSDRTLREILELPELAGPGVILKGAETFQANSRNAALRMEAGFNGEVMSQRQNVFRAFTQRRRANGKHIQAEEHESKAIFVLMWELANLNDNRFRLVQLSFVRKPRTGNLAVRIGARTEL
jgi:hypothetical protein